MKTALISGAVAGFVLFVMVVSAPAVEDSAVGDMASLQGKWKVRFDQDEYIVFEIKDKSFSMTRHTAEGPRPTLKGTFVIDEKAHPKQMTWKDVKGPSSQHLDVNKCIYELHGDTWLLMGGLKERPKHFLSGGKPHTTWILKREKNSK